MLDVIDATVAVVEFNSATKRILMCPSNGKSASVLPSATARLVSATAISDASTFILAVEYLVSN